MKFLINKSKIPSILRRIFICFVSISFIFNDLALPLAHAQNIFSLPAPGTVISLTAGYTPALVKGMTFYPNNPLQFDFIIEQGQDKLEGQAFNDEALKMIKYFLASLTVPEKDMWVNLSPNEKNRIIANGFGQTEMGRDLLAQDYMLKQLTSSLMNPEDKLGAAFWEKVYAQAKAKFGTTDIPVDTFNKIWIVPDKAVVYEKGVSAFVVGRHLKVMLEEDYKSLQQSGINQSDKKVESTVAAQIIKEILLPEIEREVNEGKTFANLRQIYNAMILSTWFKKALKESLLAQVYVDQNKVKGIDLEDKDVKEKIYNQYLEAFKKGVYDNIKEEYDPETQSVIQKKYITGGAVGVDPAMQVTKKDFAMLSLEEKQGLPNQAKTVTIILNEMGPQADSAMVAEGSKGITRRAFFGKGAAAAAGLLAAGTVGLKPATANAFGRDFKFPQTSIRNDPHKIASISEIISPLRESLTEAINYQGEDESNVIEEFGDNTEAFREALKLIDQTITSPILSDINQKLDQVKLDPKDPRVDSVLRTLSEIPGLYYMNDFDLAKPVVVFIHGKNGWPADFNNILAAMGGAHRFNVVYYVYPINLPLEEISNQYSEAVSRYRKQFMTSEYQYGDRIAIVSNSFGALLDYYSVLYSQENNVFQGALDIQLAPLLGGVPQSIWANIPSAENFMDQSKFSVKAVMPGGKYQNELIQNLDKIKNGFRKRVILSVQGDEFVPETRIPFITEGIIDAREKFIEGSTFFSFQPYKNQSFHGQTLTHPEVIRTVTKEVYEFFGLPLDESIASADRAMMGEVQEIAIEMPRIPQRVSKDAELTLNQLTQRVNELNAVLPKYFSVRVADDNQLLVTYFGENEETALFKGVVRFTFDAEKNEIYVARRRWVEDDSLVFRKVLIQDYGYKKKIRVATLELDQVDNPKYIEELVSGLVESPVLIRESKYRLPTNISLKYRMKQDQIYARLEEMDLDALKERGELFEDVFIRVTNYVTFLIERSNIDQDLGRPAEFSNVFSFTFRKDENGFPAFYIIRADNGSNRPIVLKVFFNPRGMIGVKKQEFGQIPETAQKELLEKLYERAPELRGQIERGQNDPAMLNAEAIAEKVKEFNEYLNEVKDIVMEKGNLRRLDEFLNELVYLENLEDLAEPVEKILQEVDEILLNYRKKWGVSGKDYEQWSAHERLAYATLDSNEAKGNNDIFYTTIENLGKLNGKAAAIALAKIGAHNRRSTLDSADVKAISLLWPKVLKYFVSIMDDESRKDEAYDIAGGILSSLVMQHPSYQEDLRRWLLVASAELRLSPEEFNQIMQKVFKVRTDVSVSRLPNFLLLQEKQLLRVLIDNNLNQGNSDDPLTEFDLYRGSKRADEFLRQNRDKLITGEGERLIAENLKYLMDQVGFKPGDEAMTAADPVGGIDFNPALLDLQIKRDSNGVPLPLPQQSIGSMKIEGFLPIIINVQPVTNLPQLLGLTNEEELQQLSSAK